MTRNWHESRPISNRPESEHSTKEIEHRFTHLESSEQEGNRDRVDLHSIVERHSQKLTLHERVLLGVLMGLATLLQDKYPALIAALRSLMGS